MGLLTVPKHYTPRKGGKTFPKENLIYASKAEQNLLRRMTDGKANKTKHGILSFYMEGGTGTSGTSGIGTNRDGSSTAGRTSTSSGGSYGGGGKMGSGSTQSGAGGPSGTGGASTGGGASQGGGGTQNASRESSGTVSGRPSSSTGGGTQNASREAQGNVSGTPSRGISTPGGGSTTSSRTTGNVNSQPATQKMAGSTQSNMGLNAPSVGEVTSAVRSINSLLGNVDRNVNYGLGTPGNPVPALNNRNPLQGNAPGSPNAYEKSVNDLVNAVKPRSVDQDSVMRHLTMGKPIAPASPGSLERYADMTTGGKFGVGSTQWGMAPPAPQAVTDPYGGMGKMGLQSSQTSPYNQPAAPQAVTDPYGGMGKMGMLSGQTSPYNQPAASPNLPQRPGQTTPPGWGVPDVPNYGQVVEKTPGPRVNLPSSPGYAADMGRYGLATKIPDRAYPNAPAENAAIPGQIGTNIPKNTAEQDAAFNTFNPVRSLTGAPPTRAQHPMFGTGPAQDVDMVTRFSPPSSNVSADLYSRISQLTEAMKRGPESAVGVPANMGPSYGPETPVGPEDWQQGVTDEELSQIDPASNYSPVVQVATNRVLSFMEQTPGYKLGAGLWKGGNWLGAKLSGYSDDVSLGTENSGYRTDRAPSASPGGGYSAPGTGGKNGGGSPNGGPGGINTGGGGTGSGTGTPGSGGSGSGSGNPPPFTPSPLPGVPSWYYPQYTQTWAGLPYGRG